LKDAEKEMSVSFNSCPSFSPIANPNVLTIILHLKFREHRGYHSHSLCPFTF
jgi:hypothetical protein